MGKTRVVLRIQFMAWGRQTALHIPRFAKDKNLISQPEYMREASFNTCEKFYKNNLSYFSLFITQELDNG